MLKLQFKMDLENKDKSPAPLAYNTIPDVVWYLIADYIPPDCVKTFALICHQTANIVNTRKFWDLIYKKYCLKSFGPTKRSTISLPSHLRPYELEYCDKGTLRARVVECLFLTYEPFIERIQLGYELDTLIGCTFERSWNDVVGGNWRMICKFRQKNMNVVKRQSVWVGLPPKDFAKTDNCETLGEDSDEYIDDDSDPEEEWVEVEGRNSPLRIYFGEPRHHINEGVSLLVIHSRRILSSNDKLLYENGDVRAKLLAIRHILAPDMRSSNLELDFGPVDPYDKFETTVKYNKVLKCRVYPWWHPEYQKHMN